MEEKVISEFVKGKRMEDELFDDPDSAENSVLIMRDIIVKAAERLNVGVSAFIWTRTRNVDGNPCPAHADSIFLGYPARELIWVVENTVQSLKKVFESFMEESDA